MIKKKSNNLKKVFIIIGAVLLIAGIFIGLYFAISGNGKRFYEIKLSNSTGQITLTTKSNELAPGSTIISKPITIGLEEESYSAFVRAKLIFESNSEDNRVLSFVNQLNFKITEVVTYENENYSWVYVEADNSFYLIGKDNYLKTVTAKDENYNFVETLKVPTNIEQISSLNSDGVNVQVGEDVIVKVVVEAIQSSDLLGNKKPTIENAQEFFNNFAVYRENNFISQNGFITSYTGTSKDLVLPKYVGEDYILGIKENAFVNTNVERIIVPGSYIYFGENCFNGLNNLSFVAIKSETPVKLGATSFVSNSKLEIYAPKTLLNYIDANYTTLAYFNNFVKYTELLSSDIEQIQDKTVKVLYAPNVTEFVGDFKAFSSLKVLIAPNLSKINNDAFYNLSNLINVDTPNVVEVGNNSFYNCTSLLNVSLSKKLNTIGEQSFFNCSALTNINFVQNLKFIPNSAFRNCLSIQSITLNSEELELGNAVFYECTNLRNVNIANLTKCGEYAFGRCTGLKSVNILNMDVSETHETSFTDTTLSRINFVFNNETVKTNFVNKFTAFNNRTIYIQVQNYVLTVLTGNVSDVNLADFTYFGSFSSLGNNLFKDNSVVSTINIPSFVKNFGSSFVNNCENLTSITFNSSVVPSFKKDSFEGVKNSLIIYVPNNVLDVYKATIKNVTILAI